MNDWGETGEGTNEEKEREKKENKDADDDETKTKKCFKKNEANESGYAI